MDGLVAEREQGITIDIAWRYFDTATRRIVVIDSPGHEQYTRNMASGASHADVAIMLIDARHGVKRQTRRHAAILDLMGVKRVILAVNKMDLADWSEPKFREIEADFRNLCLKFGFLEALAIPVAAVSGDNVAAKSKHMPWYTGPHLLQHLEEMPSRGSHASGPFRFPVQTVLRDGRDFRGLAGTVSSGTVRVGDPVHDILSGRTAKVAAHRHHGPRSRRGDPRPGGCHTTRYRPRRLARRGHVVARHRADGGARARNAPRLAVGKRFRHRQRLSAAHCNRSDPRLWHRDQGAARPRNL